MQAAFSGDRDFYESGTWPIWLSEAGVRQSDAVRDGLIALAATGLDSDVWDWLLGQMRQQLPEQDDPTSAFCGLSRFLAQARSPLAQIRLLQRDDQALGGLLRLFGSGPLLTEILLDDPEIFESIRITAGQPISRRVLIDELVSDTLRLGSQAQAGRLLSAFANRELLRIAYAELLGHQSWQTTSQQLAWVSDAIVEGADRWVRQMLADSHPVPLRPDGQPAGMCILATGCWGGQELGFETYRRVLLIHDPPEVTRGPVAHAALEYFQQWVDQVRDLLQLPAPAGPAFGLLIQTWDASDRLHADLPTALHYFDLKSIPWERLNLVKARAVAGDIALGTRFLEQVHPIVCRRVLTPIDAQGLKMLKHKLERTAAQTGADHFHLREAPGGIRDVQFGLELLQMVYGSSLSSLCGSGSMQAITTLREADLLPHDDAARLSENLTYLRILLHRLQLLCGQDCDVIPDDATVQDRLATWMQRSTGKSDPSGVVDFAEVLQQIQNENRQLVNHLLHDIFGASEPVSEETELVLDPMPNRVAAARILQPYGLEDTSRTMTALRQLGNESIPFLSTAHCRHHLATIAPRLLEQVSQTPDPQLTLDTLATVSESLGGKGALWELFNTDDAALQMVVRLCAGSPYLARILTSHPGMIDDLIDSLILGRLPQASELEQASLQICRGVDDIGPVLHSFKRACHLRIGIRDILGKADIGETHAALAATATACLRRAAQHEQRLLAERYGDPVNEDGHPLELMLLGLGKLGALEPNYHSDLDVLFLYACEGQTRRRTGGPRTTISHADFFEQVAQRVLDRFHSRQYGERLYDLGSRLRVAHSEPLALPLGKFIHQYRYGLPPQEFWRRLALTKARPLAGDSEAIAYLRQALVESLSAGGWTESDATQLRQTRAQAEASAAPENFKRGRGGTMDVEWIASGLQLRHARQYDDLLEPNTVAALTKLRQRDLLSEGAASELISGYRFLRQVESNVRLLDTAARHELPTAPEVLDRLAYLFNHQKPQQMIDRCAEVRRRNRELFEQILA